MRKEIADKWVAALRSGEYEQGYGMLRATKYRTLDGETGSYDAFCCLGVLCDLHRLESQGQWAGNKYQAKPYDTVEGNYLPAAVALWAGVVSQSSLTGDPARAVNPVVDIGAAGGCKSLAEVNDTKEFDFDYIANRIEEQWQWI